MDLLPHICLSMSLSVMALLLIFVIGLIVPHSLELIGMTIAFIRILLKLGKILKMRQNWNLLFRASKSIWTTLFDLPGTPYMEYVINTGSNYSLKSELLFRTYVTIGLIIISTAKIRNARVVWKMKPLNTFSFTVRIILLNVPHFLAKYQQLLALV